VHWGRSGHGSQSASAKWTRATGMPLGLRWSDQLMLVAPWGQVTFLASQSMRKADWARSGSWPLSRGPWVVSAPTGPTRVIPWSSRAARMLRALT
jgi:hypothetical protein